MWKWLNAIAVLCSTAAQPLEAQALLGSGGATSQAQTPGEGDCQLCFDYPGGGGISGPSGGGHGFSSQNCSSPGGDGPYCMDCNAFNACHSNTQYLQGGCRSWHWYCGLNHAFIEAVEAAGRAGGDPVVLASAGTGQGRAEASAGGDYLLIRDCQDRLVGAFRIARKQVA